MDSLFAPVPDSVVFMGREIALNLAFDTVLRCSALQREELFSPTEKLMLSLSLLCARPRQIRRFRLNERAALLRQIFDETINLGKRGDGGASLVDFEQDAGIIYASFLLAYGIDLYQQQGRLHWWKFISLFQNLPENSKMREVISIRAKKLPAFTGRNHEEIAQLRKLKEYYRIAPAGEDYQTGLAALFDVLERMAVKPSD